MLHGVVIDHMIEGGPAHKSNQLEPGDVVLKVDGKDVTEDTLPGMVIGSDMPGSIVTLTVQKASEEVSLRRGCVRAPFARLPQIAVRSIETLDPCYRT